MDGSITCAGVLLNKDVSLIRRYGTDGNLIWEREYDVAFNDICSNSEGTAFFTGVNRLQGIYITNYLTVLACDRFGNELWQDKVKNSEGEKILQDSEGNLVVLGYYQTDKNKIYDLIIKYDSSGRRLWIRKFYRTLLPNTFGLVGDLFVDDEDFIYLATCKSTRKLNKNGFEIWNKSYLGEDTCCSRIVVDIDYDVYVLATFKSWSACLIKYNQSGEQLWVKYLLADEQEWYEPCALALDPEGQPIISGYYHDPYENFNLFTRKYNPKGRMLWESRYDDPTGLDWLDVYDLVVDRFGNVYLMGRYCQRGIYDCVNSMYLTIKYDPDGNQEWVSYQDDKRPSSFSPVQNEEGSIYAAYPAELALSPELQWDDDEEADDDTPFIAPGHDGDDACGCGC